MYYLLNKGMICTAIMCVTIDKYILKIILLKTKQKRLLHTAFDYFIIRSLYMSIFSDKSGRCANLVKRVGIRLIVFWHSRIRMRSQKTSPGKNVLHHCAELYLMCVLKVKRIKISIYNFLIQNILLVYSFKSFVNFFICL